jgi:hypothetical protein
VLRACVAWQNSPKYFRLQSQDQEGWIFRLLIGTILSNLKTIANQVRTNSDFCQNTKEQLKNCGYDWFDGISNNRKVREQVMKVLAVAVNEAIQKRVNLRNEKMKMVNRELHQLLEIDKDKSLQHYFFPSGLISRKTRACMKSPLDLAKYVKKCAPQWLVESIFQHQFEIKWNTPTGEPADYKFSQFCDKENTTKHFKYKPRQAHVKAILYKELRRESVYDLRNITKEELCPIVYIKTTRGWKLWQADEGDEFEDVDIGDDLSWIDPSIRKFITENEQKADHKSLVDSLAKPTLYWAVLKDKDFVTDKLKSIGRTHYTSLRWQSKQWDSRTMD